MLSAEGCKDLIRSKRPESALVIVYTKIREVLLLQRKMAPAGVWQSVTGSLRNGETPMQAAVREVAEETGLTNQAGWLDTGVVNRFEIVPEARMRYAPGVTENTEYVFNLKLPDICDIRLNSAEHGDYCWVPMDVAVDKIWSWSNRQAILALMTDENS